MPWVIEIDMPTDQPWFYQTTADKLMGVLEALAILGKKILSVKETS